MPSQSRSARQLSHRESPWQAGPLPTGRLSPDMAQKGGPCYRGQRLLDKRTLSSCRESWQRSTTVSEKIRLCSFRVGLTGTPEALPLGELSPKVTERARTPTEKSRRSDSIALSKRQFIAAWQLSGDGLALSVIAARCHLSQRERLLHPAKRARTPTESFSAPFCSKNFLKIHFIGLLFCYTPVRTKRHRREEE